MKEIISINPANNAVLGKVRASTAAEISQKIEKAHAAKRAWKELGIDARIQILRPLVEIFENKKNDIANLTTQEMGKPISESIGDFEGDFIYLHDFLDNGKNYIADEITYQNGSALHTINYEPRGVAACIAPWNYPFSNFIWSVIPNLIVGNTVVFKHSEECVLTAKLLEECMLSLKLPEGVFSCIYGDGEEGSLLVSEDIDLIWFTGSSSVGRKLAAMAGEKQIKAILEMGGSNPAIIFEDADLDVAIERIYLGRFTNGGQVCDAVKRLIVHHSLFNEIIERLTERLKKVELGPLVSKKHFDLLETQVKDALDKGAKLITGGKKEGCFYLPTLLTHITKNMRVWQEEVFGPVLPMISFKSDEEAIQLANDTPYGLGALIFSKNIDKARWVASQIDAGFVDINQGSHWQPCTPFGGYKASGMGREHGRHGFQDLCQIKVVAEG